MNARGRAQAEATAARIGALAPDLNALDFVASPLGRARETMAILRRALGLDPAAYRVDPAFIELTFGEWEGLTWREVRRSAPELAAARERDKWGFVPPGGESYADLRDRLAPALAALDRPALVVSHGGVARAALNLLAGVGTDRAPKIDIWQGRVLVVEATRYRWA